MRTDTLQASNDTIYLAHTNPIPFSEQITTVENQTISAYEVIHLKSIIVLKDSSLRHSKFIVKAKYFPEKLAETYAIRQSPEKVKPDFNFLNETVYFEKDYEKEELQLQLSKLKRSGVLSRGITVGTNRDLSVNSAFRLNLEGDLGDDVSIVANMTDENLPIQPSGSSQQISDFDKVYIELRQKNRSLTLGDLEFSQKNTQFANFYRNVMGASVAGEFGKTKLRAVFSSAKGKFHTLSFTGENNKQGPYRLTGKNNERFIIVLAGSEKVYVNGQLKTRGASNDYVMDYNTGELSFTSKFLITNAQRIVVDFEYAERNYGRSLTLGQAQTKVWKDKLNIQFSYTREADNPNNPTDFTLDKPERQALQLAGDNPELAYIFGADSVGWEASQIRYVKKDTIVSGQLFQDVFIFSTDSLSAVYQVVFAYVGAKKGHYLKAQTIINGNVFQFVGADSSGFKGDYMPVRVIPVPKSLMVTDLTTQLKITEHIEWQTETAYSKEDKNRLSSLQDSDNQDLAFYQALKFKNLKLNEKWIFHADLTGRYTGKKYANIDRVNQKEYGREWNFNDLAQAQTERLADAGLSFQKKDRWNMSLRSGYRSYGSDNQTLRLNLDIQSSDSAFIKTQYSGYFLNTLLADGKSQWIRNQGDVSKRLWKIKPGVQFWLEDKKDSKEGLLQAGSFAFEDFTPYLASDSTEKLDWLLQMNYRREREALDSVLRDKSIAQTYTAKINFHPISSLTLSFSGNYRIFRLQDSLFRNQGLENTNTLLLNTQTSWRPEKKWLQWTAIYEVLTEKTARKELIYVEVNPGLGEYDWIDYNQNGLQELDEFQTTVNPLTANFVRYLLPTQQLFPTLNLQGQSQLNIEPGYLIKSSKKFLKGIQWTTAFRLEQKKIPTEEKFKNYFPEWNKNLNDSSRLSDMYSIRSDLYVFRNEKRGDLQFSLTESKSQQYLNSGTETRFSRIWGFRQRLNLNPTRSISNQMQMGYKKSLAELMETRNMDIQLFETNPMFNMQVSKKWRFSSGYMFKWKENTNENHEKDAKLLLHKFIFDTRINIKDRNNLFGKFELFNNIFNGEPNSTVSYEMLEGMQKGNNITIVLQFNWFVMKSLELTAQYDGKLSPAAPAIHSGRMQLKAYF